MQPLVLVQVAQLREHGPAHVAFEADRGYGVLEKRKEIEVGDEICFCFFHLRNATYCHWFVDHLDAAVDSGDARNPILKLIDQGVVVAKGLCNVARLVAVVCRGQLREIHRVCALKRI